MKKEIKGFICGVLTCGILGGVGVGAAGMWKNIPVLENDIRVVVDGFEVYDNNFVYNDTTYLPLRAVAEAVGKPVEYDGSQNIAFIGTIPNPDTISNSVFYSDVQWAPDYGYYTGQKLISKQDTLNNTIGKIYKYSINGYNGELVSYYNVLEELGFRPIRIAEEIKMFINGNKVVIMIDDDSTYTNTIASFVYLP